MSRVSPSPEIRDLAARLLAHETALRRQVAGKKTSAFLVGEKLRVPLSKLVGTMGYRSLMERALAIAKPQAPALEAFHVTADGLVESAAATPEPTAAIEAETILLTQFFSLMTAFVGSGLVLTVIVNVWPDFAVSTTEFAKERTYDSSRES
jgi:hypothetical protein